MRLLLFIISIMFAEILAKHWEVWGEPNEVGFFFYTGLLLITTFFAYLDYASIDKK